MHNLFYKSLLKWPLKYEVFISLSRFWFCGSFVLRIAQVQRKSIFMLSCVEQG